MSNLRPRPSSTRSARRLELDEPLTNATNVEQGIARRTHTGFKGRYPRRRKRQERPPVDLSLSSQNGFTCETACRR